MSVYLEMQIDEMADEMTALKAINQKLQLEKNALKEQLSLYGVRLSLYFAEWIDIHGIRDGQHEWKYKGDNYKKKFSTQEMFDEWQKVTTNEA